MYVKSHRDRRLHPALHISSRLISILRYKSIHYILLSLPYIIASPYFVLFVCSFSNFTNTQASLRFSFTLIFYPSAPRFCSLTVQTASINYINTHLLFLSELLPVIQTPNLSFIQVLHYSLPSILKASFSTFK